MMTYLIVIRYAQSLAAETLSAIIRTAGSAFPMKPTLKYVASKGVKSLSDEVDRELLYATILTTGASMQDTGSALVECHTNLSHVRLPSAMSTFTSTRNCHLAPMASEVQMYGTTFKPGRRIAF